MKNDGALLWFFVIPFKKEMRIQVPHVKNDAVLKEKNDSLQTAKEIFLQPDILMSEMSNYARSEFLLF